MNGKPAIKILIEGKAVPNQYIALKKGKGAIPIRTKKVKDFIKFVKDEAKQVMNERNLSPLIGPVEQHITFYTATGSMGNKKTEQALAGLILPATRYSKDLDNILKTVGDGLDGVIYKDDAQVVNLVAKKRYAERDYIKIEIWGLGFNE